MEKIIQIRKLYEQLRSCQFSLNRRETMSNLVRPFLEAVGYSNSDFGILREEQLLNSIVVDYVIYFENKPKIAILGIELDGDVELREKTIRELSKQNESIRLFVTTNGIQYNLYCLKNGATSLFLTYHVITNEMDDFEKVKKYLCKENVAEINSLLIDGLYKEKVQHLIAHDVLGVSRSFIRFVRSSIGDNVPEEVIKKVIFESLRLNVDREGVEGRDVCFNSQKMFNKIELCLKQDKPYFLAINEQIYKVDKWRNVQRKFLEYIEDNCDFNFNLKSILIPSMYIKNLNEIPCYAKKEDYWMCKAGYYISNRVSKEVVIRTMVNALEFFKINKECLKVIDSDQELGSEIVVTASAGNDRKKILSLDEDWTGKKILGFEFLEEKYFVNSFIEMQLIVVSKLVEKMGDKILYDHNQYFSMKNKGVQFKGLNAFNSSYSILNTRFALDIKNSSEEKRKSIKFLLNYASIPFSELIIFVPDGNGWGKNSFECDWKGKKPIKFSYLEVEYFVQSFSELQVRMAELIFSIKGMKPFLKHNEVNTSKNKTFLFEPHPNLTCALIKGTPFYYFTNTNAEEKKRELLLLINLAEMNVDDFKIEFE